MPKPRPTPAAPSAACVKFRKSMILDFDAWHDGTGYDMAAFAEMTDAEKAQILSEIKGKGNGEIDWRDMEVLGHDNSRESFDRLRDELVGGSADQRAKALSKLYDMKRMNDAVFDINLSRILDDVTHQDGTVWSLMCVDRHCGENTRKALLRGTRDRPDIAIHFASKLMDLANLSNDMAAFDPKFRPTLLKLLPDQPDDVRQDAMQKVWAWLGVDPAEMK